MKMRFWIGAVCIAFFSVYFLSYFSVRLNNPEAVRQNGLRQIDDFNDLSSEKKNRVGDAFFSLSMWISNPAQTSIPNSRDAQNRFDVLFAPCAKIDEMLTGESLVFGRQINARSFE
jgi:hypothetical protein